MWTEDTRSVVPVLPPISTAASPSRHTPTVTHRNRAHFSDQHSQTSLRSALHSEDREEWASGKELIVKVAELNAELSRMKAVIGHLEAERTSQDVWLKESFGHVRDQLSWLLKKMDESLNILANKMEQLEHRTTTEHSQLTAAVEQSRKGVWQYSDRIKNVLEKQISNLEKALQKEYEPQMIYTTQLNDKLSRQLGDIQTQMDSMKEDSEKERVRYGSQVTGLRNSLTEVARSYELSKEELSSVLNAEIRTRQSEVARVQSQHQKLHGLCRSSIGSVRESLLSLEERFAADRKEAQSLRDKLLQEWEGMSQRMQADMSARMVALHNHISSVNSNCNLAMHPAKDDHVTSPTGHVIPPTGHVTSTEGTKEDKKMRGVTEGGSGSRQTAAESQPHTDGVATSETIESLHKELERQSSQVNSLVLSLNELRFWMVGALQRETGERCHSVFELRKEVSNLHTQLSMALTTLNLPYSQNSNANTAQYYQLHVTHPPHSHPQPDHTADRPDQDTDFVHQSHYGNDGHNQIVHAPIDDVIHERPAGVTTTAHSPFPEVGEIGGLYRSDGESETTGTESEVDWMLTERRHKYDESAVLSQSPLPQQQVAPVYTTSDPLETSPESRSLLSSTPGVHQSLHQHQMAEGGRDSPLQHMQDDLETHGRFTSASATPDSQQKVLVLDQTRQAESDSVGGDQSEKEERLKPDCEESVRRGDWNETPADISDRDPTDQPNNGVQNSLNDVRGSREHVHHGILDEDREVKDGTREGGVGVQTRDTVESERDSSSSEHDNNDKVFFQVK